MADRRLQTTASVGPSIRLSSICLGGRSIRFLILRDKKLVSAPKTLDESPGVPLFLASDVLCGCSQMSKNFTRIHARYSKDGMATKLLLKDFRVLGVSHSTTVWFYNIRGVFQVVFEYQEKSVQRDCLSKLKDMWLCRYHDDNLPDSLSVTLANRTTPNDPTPVLQEDHKSCMGNKTSHDPDEEELFPFTSGEVAIELVKHNTDSCISLGSKGEDATSDNSTEKHHQMNGISLLDNVVNGIHTREESVKTVVGQAPLVADLQTSEDNAQELGEQDRLVADVNLCHSCGSLNCPSFQSTVTEDGETSWGTCLPSRLERSLLNRPLCCSKATQIDTVPRSVTKVSVGVQTDQFVSLVQDCLKTNSKAVTYRNACPQTDITMETFVVLTPRCLHGTKHQTKCHNKCSKTNCRKKHQSKHYPRTNVLNECISVLETLIKYLVQLQPDLQNVELSPVVKRVRIILQLLMQEIRLEENQGFPFQLIQEYLDMLGTERSAEDGAWGNSSQRNTFLHIVCHWLGQEFHKFEPTISQRVEDFKQDHINCIDNLPPAESIIDLVFPSCMKELVVSWTSQVSQSPCGRAGSDHDYSPPVKKLCVSDCSAPAYPLVQHILEFANHALVSGVAHVVYSRLRHST